MSTDYDVACHTCRILRHVGQRFTSGWAFGYGTNDAAGQRAVGDWIVEHLDAGHDVRLHVSDSAPLDFTREEAP